MSNDLNQIQEKILDEYGVWIYTYPIQPFTKEYEDIKITWVVKAVKISHPRYDKYIGETYDNPKKALATGINIFLNSID
jgi:hypothetical protein